MKKKSKETKREITCKSCGEPVHYLHNVQSGEAQYRLFLRGTEPLYEMDEFYPDNIVNDFRCPVCDSVLAATEEEAVKLLLKGGERDV